MTNYPGFDDGNGHSAINQVNATVTFSFSGDRVALYGVTGTSGGPFTAQIDNGTTWNLTTQQTLVVLDPQAENDLVNQLIFYADSLPPGHHILKLVSKPESPTQGLAIDYAIVDGSANSMSLPITSSSWSPMSPSSSSPPVVSHIQHSKITSAQIGGATAGITFLLLLIYSAIWYLRRRKRKSTSSAPTIVRFPADLVAAPRLSKFSPPESHNEIDNAARNSLSTQPPNYVTLWGGNSVEG
ncbi:hypothetical protein C8J57DRAFT_1345832 [Mycena rebaudengoi]|nr:hypothetical protein C8J57DRAFT_1345832 [Mycena rebaudengoi]